MVREANSTLFGDSACVHITCAIVQAMKSQAVALVWSLGVLPSFKTGVASSLWNPASALVQGLQSEESSLCLSVLGLQLCNLVYLCSRD